MEYLFVVSGEIGSMWDCSVSPDYVRYELGRNKGKEVHVGFCSLGGRVDKGLELYTAFKDHGNVHAHAFGMNASISTVAMLGCKTVDIVKGSFFLIHNSSTAILKWERANKETLARFIEEMKLQHESLATIDDVMAQLYAEKSGKTIEEVKVQMNKGTWLSAQQAVDFGLVDSIREDKDSEKAAANIAAEFIARYDNSSIIKDAGIPPLITDSGMAAAVVDAQGNPTPSFLEKTCKALQSLFYNNHADNPKESMITIFASIMALLSVKDGFKPQEDGTIALSQDQMKMLDDELKTLGKDKAEKQKAVNASAEAIKKLQAKVKELETEVKEKEEQIIALQEGAGAEESKQATAEAGKDVSVDEVFNLIKCV